MKELFFTAEAAESRREKRSFLDIARGGSLSCFEAVIEYFKNRFLHSAENYGEIVIEELCGLCGKNSSPQPLG